MKKTVAAILALVLALAGVSAFAEDLPAFRQDMKTPDDIGAFIANSLADPQRAKENFLFGDGCVAIPVPVIFRLSGADPLEVCGNFIVDVYRLNGDTLEYVSGGENAGVITLEKGENGWKVVREEYAGDGEAFAADIARFAGGDAVLLRQYQEVRGNHEMISAARFSAVCDYIRQTHLDIRYYQLPGCDPVAVY